MLINNNRSKKDLTKFDRKLGPVWTKIDQKSITKGRVLILGEDAEIRRGEDDEGGGGVKTIPETNKEIRGRENEEI